MTDFTWYRRRLPRGHEEQQCAKKVAAPLLSAAAAAAEAATAAAACPKVTQGQGSSKSSLCHTRDLLPSSFLPSSFIDHSALFPSKVEQETRRANDEERVLFVDEIDIFRWVDLSAGGRGVPLLVVGY